MPDDHPLTAQTDVTLVMLADMPLILYDAYDANEHLSIVLQQEWGSRSVIAYRTGSSLNVLAMAAAGLGLALVPLPLGQVNVPGLVYRPLNAPALTANLMLISRQGETSAAVKAWLVQRKGE
jgi:transcriptional regulator, LysR family